MASSAPVDRRPLLPDHPVSRAPKRGRTISEAVHEPPPSSMAVAVSPSGAASAGSPSGGGGDGAANVPARERTFSASDVEVDLEGWQGSCFCHPQSLFHRYIYCYRLETYLYRAFYNRISFLMLTHHFMKYKIIRKQIDLKWFISVGYSVVANQNMGNCHELKWINIHDACFRIIALVMMCLLGFGSYFCFDNPGALQSEIKVSIRSSAHRLTHSQTT